MTLETYFAAATERDWDTAAPEGTVRMAVVGVGGFAKDRAVPAMQAATYVEPTVLVTDSPAVVAEEPVAAGIDHCIHYDAFLEGAAREAYDAVYVATPNALHRRYAVAAAEMGAHVICEKPLETSVERAREIIEACEAADVTLMTAYRHQLEPIVRRARDLLVAGELGDVVQIHAGFSHPLLEYADADSWRLDPELAGGGALIDLGVYPLNTIRFFLECEPTGVFATTHSPPESPFTSVERDVAFQLQLPRGATASCTASYDAHANSQLQVLCTNGLLRIAAPFSGVIPHEVHVESGDLSLEYTGEPTDEVREEFDYFGYCVLTGTAPEPDGEDGLADVAVMEATYAAAELDSMVTIDAP